MNQIIDISLLNSIIRMVTPILLAALGGALCARAGLFNVGLEGMILVGAFGAVLGNYLLGNLGLAVLFAVGCVLIFSLLYGYFTIHLKANVIVVGIAINFLAMGLTTFLLSAIFHVKGAYYNKDMEGLPLWNIPILSKIPVLGEVLSGYSPIVFSAFLLVIVLHLFLYRTVAGFRFSSVGQSLIVAQSTGIKVRRYQYAAVLTCGVLCGLAGAQLSLGQVTMFAEGMTSGRGFIALVAMMLGQANPLGIMGSSLLFGLMDALSVRMQGLWLPTPFTMMLPYAVTIAAMFFFKDKSYLHGGSSSSR
ncbi:simple sugar transport system permease protein [Paenibacillus forsythiae]|uniref:Simple sugar transport system permease protein n=1 Tax=Paenibacillus forsythiae TaxID=365616 RepID=A0ABU3HA03_9BACL|nr:ABC transporter permease [Paenibacillus forsythiae]MDT3427581.1 simple sugar transport system permease protein [Paenibacillus forsythiae]